MQPFVHRQIPKTFSKLTFVNLSHNESSYLTYVRELPTSSFSKSPISNMKLVTCRMTNQRMIALLRPPKTLTVQSLEKCRISLNIPSQLC